MDSTHIVPDIVEQIADLEGVDPIDIDVPVYDVLDVDALEALMDTTGKRQPPANLQVEFTYYGYTVTITGAGRISVDEQQPDANPEAPSRNVSSGD